MNGEHARPAIRVVVAAPFAQLVGLHGRVAEYADEIELCGAISDATRVLEQTRHLQPEVLLLSAELGLSGPGFIELLTAAAPATGLVVLVADATAVADGSDTVTVADGADAGALREAVVRAARRVDVDTAPAADLGPTAGPPAGGREAVITPTAARTVLVFSGKGGVGKSVVATNLATALATRGLRVALVDLDLQYGDVGVMLHLEDHATTIESIAPLADAGLLEGGDLDTALATTSRGLHALLAPRTPEAADVVTLPALGLILTHLGRNHDYLVIDSPAHLEERILGVIEVADQVLLVTSPNITAVKDTKATLRLLQSLEVDPERVAVVLNQNRPRGSFSGEEIETALHFPLLAKLPYDKRMDAAVDAGAPLVLSEPRAAFTRQLSVVVEHLHSRRAAAVGVTSGPQQARWRLRFSQH